MSAQPPRVRMNLPEAQAGGHFADFVSVSHQPGYFTLDFAVVTFAQQADDGATELNAQVVSRIRIMPEQVFEIMKALEGQLSRWEVETGRRAPTTETPPWPSPSPSDSGGGTGDA